MLCINQTAVHVKLNDIKVQQTTELNEMICLIVFSQDFVTSDSKKTWIFHVNQCNGIE